MPEPGMGANNDHSTSASRSSFGGGGADNSSSTDNDNKSTTAESLSQSPSTADNLASSPTTADTLSGKAANDDRNSAPSAQSGSMTPEQARMTAEQSAMPTANLADNKPPEAEDSKIIGESFDLFATDNPHFNVEVVSVDLTVESPDIDIDTEKRRASASAGKYNFDVTALRGTADLSLGPIADLDFEGTVKTVNANGNLEAYGELKGLNSKIGIKGSAGAEAMAVDGKASIDISITPKSIVDSVGGVYNTLIDPQVDKAFGYDVPGIPEAPDSWDKGLAVSGYVEGGFGASAKAHGGAEFGKGTKNGLSGGFKIGAGPVAGLGGFIGVKLD